MSLVRGKLGVGVWLAVVVVQHAAAPVRLRIVTLLATTVPRFSAQEAKNGILGSQNDLGLGVSLAL
jgi:hypothetical protein